MEEQAVMERYEEMLRYIREKRKVSVKELSNRFKTSPCTVRRILAQMSRDKLVKRFYGGVLSNTGNPEPPVSKRSMINQTEKDLIGKKAADSIGDGETVILLGGTTVNAMCPHLKSRSNIKVITNSILILNELLESDGIEVIFLGGVLNRKESFVTGYLTSLCIKELHAKKLFLGVRALHPSYGLMLDDVNELDIYRNFMASAEEIVITADYSKFNQDIRR